MSISMKQVINVALASLFIAAPALAVDSGARSGAETGRPLTAKKLECGGAPCERAGKIQFTDSQLEKMSALKNQFMDKSGARFAELGSLHRQLKDVLSQPTIDRSKAESLQAKINTIKSDLSMDKLNLRIEEIGILTPEQREIMHHRMLMSEAFGGRFGHHRHFSGGRHFGHGEHGERGGERPDRT